MQWLDFLIIIQVNYKEFIVFSPEETLLDANTFLISTSSKKQENSGEIYAFQFQFFKTL